MSTEDIPPGESDGEGDTCDVVAAGGGWRRHGWTVYRSTIGGGDVLEVRQADGSKDKERRLALAEAVHAALTAPAAPAALADSELRSAVRAWKPEERGRGETTLQPEVALPTRWPKAREVGRIGDMGQANDTHMRLLIEADGDVCVEVWDRTDGQYGNRAVIEFCAIGAGGGRSPRTRDALIALMVAMEEDNAESPDAQWPPQREEDEHGR